MGSHASTPDTLIRGASPAEMWSALFASREARSYRDMCVICHDRLSSLDYVKTTCCEQDYHLTCLAEWVVLNPTCPMCRSVFRTNLQRTLYRRSRLRVPLSTRVPCVVKCLHRVFGVYVHVTPQRHVQFTVAKVPVYTITRPIVWVDDGDIYIIDDDADGHPIVVSRRSKPTPPPTTPLRTHNV